jgi:hypothetical protein
VFARAANFALPSGSGYMKAGEGWMDTIRANASESSVFYATFDLASVGVFSPYPRIYKRLTYTPSATGVASGDIITIPVYTAIIQMTNGVVTDIGWDDGCLFCPENTDECTFNAFSVNASQPIPDQTLRGCRKASVDCYPETFTNDNAANGTAVANATLTDSACDLKVFLTWTGTDKNGQFLRSAGKRFSRYRAFGIATAYQSAINLATDAVAIGETALGAIKEVPGKILPGVNDEGRRRRLILDEGHGGSDEARDEIGVREWEQQRGRALVDGGEGGYPETVQRFPSSVRV